MEEFDNAIDPDNDTSYGISSKGHEVMIVNERKNQHSIYCSISRTDVVVLKHLNYLMEQCKEPGVNQQIAYEAVKISVELYYHYQQIIIRGTELQLMNNINLLLNR